MVELTVGSRFYYKNKLCEVVQGGYSCVHCVFHNRRKCKRIKCTFCERHDKNDVYFKEIKHD